MNHPNHPNQSTQKSAALEAIKLRPQITLLDLYTIIDSIPPNSALHIKLRKLAANTAIAYGLVESEYFNLNPSSSSVTVFSAIKPIPPSPDQVSDSDKLNALAKELGSYDKNKETKPLTPSDL